MRTAYALEGATFLLLIVGGLLLTQTSRAPSSKFTSMSTTTSMEYTLTLTTPAFQNNTPIPATYTCDGQDISPELHIGGAPTDTKSLVLIVDDPDSPTGTWDHWVVFDIAPATTVLPQGTEPDGVAGSNTWKKTGYGGPCPGNGEHHYVFKLYALDAVLGLEEGSTKTEVETAMQGHIIAEARLTGLYERKK